MDDVKAAMTTAASGAPVPPEPSIVVLPFTNLSPDKENEYFGDGLTEEIIGSLSNVSGLRAIARASSFRLRGESDLAKIGRMLHVAHTLDGSVRKAGNRVRISVQLTRIADETPVWSERFDRDMTDIFAIQDEIAEAVVKSLEARLMKPQPANRPDVNAYILVLRAQQMMWRVSGNSIRVAEQLYEEAIRIDPNFAAAPGWNFVALQSGKGLASLEKPRSHTRCGQARRRADVAPTSFIFSTLRGFDAGRSTVALPMIVLL